MGSNVIRAEFDWEVDDSLEAFRCAERHRRGVIVPFLLTLSGWLIIAVGLVVLTAVWMTVEKRHDSQAELGGVIMIVFGAFILLQPSIGRWTIRRRFLRHEQANRHIAWQFEDRNIFVQSPLGASILAWQAVIKIVEGPRGVLIYSAKNNWNWLPRYAFASDADYERFVGLARKRVAKYYGER